MTTIRAGGLPAASLGSIFDASPQPMLAVEPNANRIIDANPAACRLLGYDRELLRSLKFTDLHPGQRPALIVFTQAVMAKGSFWSHSLSARHAAGHELALEYEASVISGPDDETPRLLVIMTDLAERRRRAADAKPISRCAAASRSGSASNASSATSSARTSSFSAPRAKASMASMPRARPPSSIRPPNGCSAGRRRNWSGATCIRSCTTPIPTASHYHDHDCPIYGAFRDGVVHQRRARDVLAQGRHVVLGRLHLDTDPRPRRIDRRGHRVPRYQPASRGRRKAARRAPGGRQPARAAGAGERLSPGADPLDGNHRGIIGEQRRDPEDAAAGRAGRADRRHRADHGRVRHRQGAARPRHPRGEPAAATGR